MDKAREELLMGVKAKAEFLLAERYRIGRPPCPGCKADGISQGVF